MAPWSWQRLPTALPLASYLLAVIAAELALTGWLFTRTPLGSRELLLFGTFLCCGAVCVEATRRWGAPPAGTRDLLSAWWLPEALLLPPAYALAAPVLIGGLAHWRARQGPFYWRAFTAAALGLAGAAASALFHLAGAHGRWFLHAGTLATAAGCAGLFIVANAGLVAVAAHAADPFLTWRAAVCDAESLLLDLTGLCAGVLVTIACALTPVLLVVALPPVILLQRSLLHQQLNAAARTDAKTGLLNAAAWQREADSGITCMHRSGSPAAILLADIDHFKRVNDTYGHLVGDELLAAMAAALVRHARAQDVLGRFGGEEFVAFLPGVGTQEACRIADRLRQRVSAVSVVAAGEPVMVTISIGVAALGTHGDALFELLAAADAALYRAKESGRDQVCLLPPAARPSDPPP